MEAETRSYYNTVFKLQILMFIFIVYLPAREILMGLEPTWINVYNESLYLSHLK